MRVSEAELRVIRLLQQQITEGCERGELFERAGMTVATAEGLLYRFFKRNGICNRNHFYRRLGLLDFSQLATIQEQRKRLNPKRGVKQRGNRWIAYASHTRESSGYLGSFDTEEEALAARRDHDLAHKKRREGDVGKWARGGLTEAEGRIVELLCQKGISNKELAQELICSERTVQTHLRNIYRKFGLQGRMELVLKAQRGELESATVGR